MYELSILLPHFLKEGAASSTSTSPGCTTRCGPIPDGFSWLEVLTDEDKIGLHVALTPTWSETAHGTPTTSSRWASAAERHDTHSYETQAGQAGSASASQCYELQPSAKEKTYRANLRDESLVRSGRRLSSGSTCPGRLTRMVPSESGNGSNLRTIRAGPCPIDEYYGWMFDNSVPGLPDKAAAEEDHPAWLHAQVRRLSRSIATCMQVHENDPLPKRAVEIDGKMRHGFKTSLRKQARMVVPAPWHDWGWARRIEMPWLPT